MKIVRNLSWMFKGAKNRIWGFHVKTYYFIRFGNNFSNSELSRYIYVAYVKFMFYSPTYKLCAAGLSFLFFLPLF